MALILMTVLVVATVAVVMVQIMKKMIMDGSGCGDVNNKDSDDVVVIW